MATEDLLCRLCDLAIHVPSIDNIDRLHRAIRGPCRSSLQELPRQTLLYLADQVVSIVRATKATDEESPILLCIGILIYLDQACGSNRQNPENSDGDNLNHHVIEEFFRGSKLPKTIQLVLLRTIWACKCASPGPREGMIRCLRLARETLELFGGAVLADWRASHAPIVQKLVEKLSQESLSTDAQCEVSSMKIAVSNWLIYCDRVCCSCMFFSLANQYLKRSFVMWGKAYLHR